MTHSLKHTSPAKGHRKPSTRVGRGVASKGKTCGRGHKGQKSRSGASVSARFEGGQMPLYRRVPKSGFSSRVSQSTTSLPLGVLDTLPVDVNEHAVTVALLRDAGLVRHNIKRVRLYLSGEVKKAWRLDGVAVTRGARAALEKVGGGVVHAD